MDDQQTWRQALADVEIWYGALAREERAALDLLIDWIMALKEELLDLALEAGSAAICRSCGGACCLHGKYYVTILDLLAYHRCSLPVVSPEFDAAPCCPYGCTEGCRMPPRFRPMTCVIFNCEQIEEQFGAAARQRAVACEGELRRAIAESEVLAGKALGRGVLLCAGF